MNTVKSFIACALLLGGFVRMSWGLYQLGKRISYELAYRGMVEETVRGMVKAEALK